MMRTLAWFVAGLLLVGSTPALAQPQTVRVSVTNTGSQGTELSLNPSISSDGRYVAFTSYSRLSIADSNNSSDIYVRDQKDNTTRLISYTSAGTAAAGGSDNPVVTSNGAGVAFESYASTIVSGDTNGTGDIFVRDIPTGTTHRVSTPSGGGQTNAVSNNPSIAGNGSLIAFQSGASNLISSDGNGKIDIFVRNFALGATERVSVATDGSETNMDCWLPAISADGRYVVFDSGSSNLVPGDTNSQADVFLHDRQAHTTRRISVSKNGTQGDGPSTMASISADGTYVAFGSSASNLIDGATVTQIGVYIVNTMTGVVQRVSVASDGTEGNGISAAPNISADGRYVAFMSNASNLVPGDTNGAYDVFVRDTGAGITYRVSVASGGGQSNGRSEAPRISADGRYVAFVSEATNLVPGDTNGQPDVFVRGPLFDGSTQPFSFADVALALARAGGMAAALPADLRLDVVAGGGINLLDCVRLMRKVGKLDPNP
jgi:Tol biopolymer transport system component